MNHIKTASRLNDAKGALAGAIESLTLVLASIGLAMSTFEMASPITVSQTDKTPWGEMLSKMLDLYYLTPVHTHPGAVAMICATALLAIWIEDRRKEKAPAR
ncbi:MAG: hypothetical protein E6R08_00635 [Nevskiaceae bacterium]|nr:MAG: hypothetical protein E6R08_00635 [Nevskiaceae bacterium]